MWFKLGILYSHDITGLRKCCYTPLPESDLLEKPRKPRSQTSRYSLGAGCIKKIYLRSISANFAL